MTREGKRRAVSTGPPEVRAAGGVVLRSGKRGRREVALVHRPSYDDWSLPKGKIREGEDWLAAALREVEEETGLRCEARRELTPSRYIDHKGRRKLVRWWLMEPVKEKRFKPHDEVDDLIWLPLAEAIEKLDYAHDQVLIRAVRRRG
jgi:8-oxo-dGTP diphosphatase